VVLYAGRIIPVKGIDRMIASLPSDMRITVLGRPYDQQYFESLKQQSKGRAVSFIIDADDAVLVDAYRTCRVAVLPSIRSQAGTREVGPNVFGLTLVEAMACGTPVVCTEAGAEPELIDDGIDGFVVPPDDWEALGERIQQLMGDDALAEKMGAAARRKVETTFTWSKVAERCLVAYVAASPTKNS
jgi:glycosyltransferase involved in cell wall biosynthesis